MGEEVLSRAPLIYEGKAKRVRKCPNNSQGAYVLMEFKDSLTAFDAVKRDERAGKGRLNCAISSRLWQELNADYEATAPIAFIAQVSPTHQLMHRVDIISLEIIVRNEAHGSLCKRFGIEPGTPIPRPLIEVGLKNDALHDPFFSHLAIPVEIMGLLTSDEMHTILNLTEEVNDGLRRIYLGHGIKLLDFKLEFGRLRYGDIAVADEITGDTCRLVDAQTGEKLDKDLFRFDTGDVMTGYVGLAQRLGLDPEAILQGRWC
ncbi:phosphoribosylaminoimidazolesuccinocarboxamide synthase [Patescibacteria group bacterium]|nr:phosphoribosylaminoimidazolesuccinocarboxamide synthase [Patescibacteria group bacterium]